MSDAPIHSNSSAAKNLRRRVARWLSRRWRDAGSAGVSPLPAAGIHRILICRTTKTLGETLLLAPLLCELEILYPGAEVELVTRCAAAPALFAAYPQVRRVHVLPQRLLGAPVRLWRGLRALRAAHFDLAIDPYLWSHSDRMLLALARARYGIGFDSSRKNGHLSHAVTAPDDLQHAAKLPVFLLRRAADKVAVADADALDYPLLDLRLSAAERSAGAHALAAVLRSGDRSRAIGVYAHATGVKSFELGWWAEFLALMQAQFPHHAIVEILPMSGRSLLADRYPTFYSSDLRKLAGVLSQLALFVSADCGVMHLASASGAPTVGIFKATDIPGWGVYGPRRLTLNARGCTAAEVAAQVVRDCPPDA